MNICDWARDFSGSIMICGLDGTILEMNAGAVQHYQKHGGMELVGKNLLECHPEPARSKLEHMLKTGGRNVYTIEKNGARHFIYQAPWEKEGRRLGMVELIIEIPHDLPNLVRT